MVTKKLMQLSTAAILGSTLLLSTSAFAHQEGDLFIRAGLGSVMPNESSDDVLGTGELEITDDTNIAGTVSYMLSDTTGVEVLLGLPFTHEVGNTGLGGGVADVSQLPLSVVIQHYFSSADSDIRPYVGAGFNYTTFLDEKGKGALASATVSVDASFGYAIQAGVDYSINDDIFLNLSAWYLDIETDINVEGFPSISKPIGVTVDPLAVMVAVGYTF